MCSSDLDLVGAERAGLAQDRVHEGGLAVVDVGNDRHIADFRAFHEKFL